MANRGILTCFALLVLFVSSCSGSIYLTNLTRTLIITASPIAGQVLKAGEDSITVSWTFNSTFPSGPESSCPHSIVSKPYSTSNNSFTGIVKKSVPTAMYFVRAYALDASEHEMAYGQTTDSGKTSNLFQVDGISGRHTTLDITSICFSVFAIVSLFGFFTPRSINEW